MPSIGGIVKGTGKLVKSLSAKSGAVADMSPEQLAKMSDDQFNQLLQKEMKMAQTSEAKPVKDFAYATPDEVDNMSESQFKKYMADFDKVHNPRPAGEPDLPPSKQAEALSEAVDEEEIVNHWKNGLITDGELEAQVPPHVFDEVIITQEKEGFTQVNGQSLEALSSNLEDWQIDQMLVEDKDKLTIANKLAGYDNDDNVSLELALRADKLDHVPNTEFGVKSGELPALKTMFAVRGGSFNRVLDKINGRLRAVNNANPSEGSEFSGELYHQEIKRQLPKGYIEATAKMSDLEKASLNFYTERGDQAVNWALRGGKVQPGSNLDHTIEFMNNSLEKLPAWQGVAYRSAGRDMWDRYREGQEIVEEGFSSFTRTPTGVKNKKDLDTDTIHKGKPPMNVTFVVQSKSGRYIEPFTEFTGEEEVLFKAGSRFRVVDKDPDLRQIFLEEVE